METLTKVATFEEAIKVFNSLADVNEAFKTGCISSDLFLSLLDYFQQR